MAADTELRVRNIISKSALCYGSRCVLHITGKN